MTKFKITYFDVNGGRAQPIRLALYLGDIDFEDYRFPFSEFDKVKQTTPLQQVPTLEIDNQQITQSNAITRYVGKLTQLYPEDNFNALLCDEIMDSVEDVTFRIVNTFGLADQALIDARQKLLTHYLKPHLNWLQQKLAERDFFIENRLTIADLKVITHIAWLNSGMLDHIATDLVETDFNKIHQHYIRVMSQPKIAQYYNDINN